MSAFKNIKKCLDDFEAAVRKNGNEITKEDEHTIFYSDLHLAEAIMKDWGNPEKVATFILTEKALPEKLEVKFRNFKEGSI